MAIDAPVTHVVGVEPIRGLETISWLAQYGDHLGRCALGVQRAQRKRRRRLVPNAAGPGCGIVRHQRLGPTLGPRNLSKELTRTVLLDRGGLARPVRARPGARKSLRQIGIPLKFGHALSHVELAALVGPLGGECRSISLLVAVVAAMFHVHVRMRRQQRVLLLAVGALARAKRLFHEGMVAPDDVDHGKAGAAIAWTRVAAALCYRHAQGELWVFGVDKTAYRIGRGADLGHFYGRSHE